MLAKVAAKNHRNALANPKAQLPLDITYEEILNKSDDENLMITPPLRLIDCLLV